MSAQPNYISSSPAIAAGARSSDPQVQKLMAQIKDWETCPTTDPQTKKRKVDALEAQLSGVEASISDHAKASAQMGSSQSDPATASMVANATGKGLRLDVAA